MLKDKGKRRALLKHQKNLYDEYCMKCPKNKPSNNDCVHACPVGQEFLQIGKELLGNNFKKQPAKPKKTKKKRIKKQQLFEWRQLTNEECKDLYYKLRDQKYSLESISDMLGTSLPTLYRWRNKHNIF